MGHATVFITNKGGLRNVEKIGLSIPYFLQFNHSTAFLTNRVYLGSRLKIKFNRRNYTSYASRS